MNKSALLTILGAALLSASKKKGSNSNLDSMMKVSGFPDGKVHVTAKITYSPMRDPRKGGTEFYFDLHEYIDPAIKLISYMNLYRIENNQSLNDEVDLDIAEEFAKKNGGRLHTIDDSCWEAYGDLPIAPERVDIQGVESKTYNHYDLYDIVQNDEINVAFVNSYQPEISIN